MIHTLGLLARGGHGKTTIVNYLRQTYGVRIVSLATPLKKIAQVVMDFDDSQLYGTQEQKEALHEGGARDAKGRMISARIFLQKLGTEGLRTFIGDDVFCEGLASAIRRDYQTIGVNPKEMLGPDVVYGVDDMRFPNEAAFVNNLENRHRVDSAGAIMPVNFGHVFKILCTDAPPTGNDNHPSEAGVDQVPLGSLRALIVSSRAQGVNHLIGELEAALNRPECAGLRRALDGSKARLGL